MQIDRMLGIILLGWCTSCHSEISSQCNYNSVHLASYNCVIHIYNKNAFRLIESNLDKIDGYWWRLSRNQCLPALNSNSLQPPLHPATQVHALLTQGHRIHTKFPHQLPQLPLNPKRTRPWN